MARHELKKDPASRAAGSEFHAVVIGASAGGLEALKLILSSLPESFPLPVLIVQHLHHSDNGSFARHLDGITTLKVVEPCDKEKILPSFVYLSPANYHMLVERCGSVALSVDERVKWSRPSIDVLFESAALAWGKRLIAVILTGANDDGASGMLAVRRLGGLTIAQAPESAEYPMMPQAAIDAGGVEKVMELQKIGELLVELGASRTRNSKHETER